MKNRLMRLLNSPLAARKFPSAGWIMLLMSCLALAQGTNAVLSGTVTDPTGAAIPGAVVTAQNVKTGVAIKTASNGAGVYQFPSLQPGVYRVSTEKDGFQKLVHNEVLLEVSAQVSLNIELKIGITADAIEVSANDRTGLGTATTSAGGVITGNMVRELPLPNRDALELVFTQPGVFDHNMNGARKGSVYITRDGINIQDNRQDGGLSVHLFNSVDLIEEVRVVTSPADAEYGRGSGQVQLITRSGTNQFHGSVFEQHRSKALNANKWFDNLQGRPLLSPIHNQFGARLGGPIKRNKTFFHVVYEGQRKHDKDTVNSLVLTQTARQGIFRFFPGVTNANANARVPTVDVNGNPVAPPTATGPLQSVNLFGRDPNRFAMDSTGIIAQYLKLTPLPNNLRSGDGLNTAGFSWTRSDTEDFDNLTIKIDHQINDFHRISYTYTRDNEERLNDFLAQRFPNTPGGFIIFKNRLHSLTLTSTLRPNLVNELRAGTYRPSDIRYGSINVEGASELLPRAGGQQFALNVESIGSNFLTNPFQISDAFHGRVNPVYQYADNISWLKGRHSFKGGGELRFMSTNGFNSTNVFPQANLGAGGVSVQKIDNTNIPGLGSNTTNAQRVLNLLSGSLASVVQAFNSPGGADPQFLPGLVKQRTWRQREATLFFKDEFKLRPNFSLNLGVRYEFYGVPYDANGRTSGLVGGSGAIFGISGNSFAAMYQPGITGGSLTRIQQVGKNSPNPKEKLYNTDWNNFAPAVGLSWGIPWLGKEKTILRVGYSMGYERHHLRVTDLVAGDQPGLRTTTTFTNAGAYLDLTDVRLPLTPEGKPFETVPLTQRTQTVRSFDENLRTAYYQNWNVSLQRSLGWKTTLEVRYVGNKGSKLPRATNVNEANIFETGILDAFLVTQAGGNSPLLDRLFMGLNINGLGVVDGKNITGSDVIRFNTTTRDHLVNNNVGSFANWLNTTNTYTNQNGGLLRRAGLPENFIVVNPQFLNAHLTGNFANSTYHALQVEVSKRLSAGLQFNSNYSWSRALGDEDGTNDELLNNYRDGRNRRMDKRLLSFHRTHIFKNSGTAELPFGPKKRFLNSNHGVLSRLVGNWQIGFIYTYTSGSPLSIESNRNSLNQFGDDNTPDIVGPFPKSTGKATVTNNGVVYFDGLKQVRDPSIANQDPRISNESDLRAIVDASGRLLLVNPPPGRLGTLGLRYIEGPGRFSFHANIVKRIQIREVMNLEFRVDARDVLNHPLWKNPNTDINSGNFGRITDADGARSVVITARINF